MLEKENGIATNQCGHNSGVTHAGVHYKTGSMKAQFCRDCAQATREFCIAHNIPYKICGKLNVATDAMELQRMEEIEKRAQQNGIQIERISEGELPRLERNISGVGGLLSPSTGIVDFGRIASSMAAQFEQRGGTVLRNCKVTKGYKTSDSTRIETSKGAFYCGCVVVCASLHSDRMVTAFGHVPDWRIIPFRGECYRIQNQPEILPNT